jgi:hypothetical protein
MAPAPVANRIESELFQLILRSDLEFKLSSILLCWHRKSHLEAVFDSNLMFFDLDPG